VLSDLEAEIARVDPGRGGERRPYERARRAVTTAIEGKHEASFGRALVVGEERAPSLDEIDRFIEITLEDDAHSRVHARDCTE
jgi:hypothetical protein